jgi:transcriptional regulator GlxA family with amidase domain
MSTGATTHRAGLLVFEGCDLLDVGGPYEALLTADRLLERRGANERIEVVTLGVGTPPLTSYGGLGLVPELPAAASGDLDVLVVPGMIHVERALADRVLVDTIRSLAARVPLVTSVCTGSFLLAAAGLLTDRTATTHHEDIDALAARDDVGAVRRGVRFVGDERIITAGGLASGLSLGLHLVERFVNRELAVATAAQLEYPFEEHEELRS